LKIFIAYFVIKLMRQLKFIYHEGYIMESFLCRIKHFVIICCTGLLLLLLLVII